MTLQYAQSLALPFWEIGFVYAALQMFRGEQVSFSSLLEGFRRFGSVLRLRLTEAVLYLGVAIVCLYASSFLFVATPFAQPMVDLFMPLMEENTTMEQIEAAIMELPLDTLMQTMAPYFVIFGVLFLTVGVFLFYRFRVADFIVMDQRKTGGLRALIASGRMTKKNRLALLRLDLSFWWFYLLLLLTGVVGYLDLLLPLVGVTLPISSDLAWFVFYVLGMLAQLALFWYGHSYVQTTYAAAYEALLQQPQVQPEPKPVPKNLPWDDYQTE